MFLRSLEIINETISNFTNETISNFTSEVSVVKIGFSIEDNKWIPILIFIGGSCIISACVSALDKKCGDLTSED